MKLTLQIQLLPDMEQAAKLKSTIERFNEACSWLAKQAFESKTANKIRLQQHFYYDLREKFDLSAQMAAICIRHVGGTYSRDKSILPVVWTFRSCGCGRRNQYCLCRQSRLAGSRGIRAESEPRSTATSSTDNTLWCLGGVGDMAIEIRPVKTQEEYHDVERLQREIWGAQDIEIIGFETLMTAHRNGGVMLGAFDIIEGQERMVGFVFGFVGLTADGRVKHCSHIAGALPPYRDRGVGYALKLKQREIVLAQGIDLITWTFDPLESRNARFNFHKLGVTCGVYLRNLYGAMRDALNAGLPSDRFQVDWRIAGPRVEAKLRGSREPAPVSSPVSLLMADGVPEINPLVAGESLRSSEKAGTGAERLLIQIPSDFQGLKAANRNLALEWRLRTRALFEEAFAKGYIATDLLVDGGQSYYLLEKRFSE